MEKFIPVVRFITVSDVHYKDEPSPERERMALALKKAYGYAESHNSYNHLDAVVVVGDFATSGTETQMQAFKQTLDSGIKEGTKTILSVSSHEFHDGEEAALEKLKRIFNEDPDNHDIINGFHFISLTTTRGTRFGDEKTTWLAEQLEQANQDDPKKPIFVFQHPHIQSTVYGSILWGEDDLIPTMMNYPQIIDFSGHSHAPINDPRSIHQKYFTCLGTGTLSYFELDEFDKIYGTVPPRAHDAAQFLIVEADKDNRVRIYPYDVLTENFFPFEWKIDKPYDPSSFLYTDERYRTAVAPYFEEGTKAEVSGKTENACTLTFGQAKIEKEYVNGYEITVKYADSGLIAKQLSIWSDYYLYNMPEELSVEIKDLRPGTQYTAEIVANSFWHTYSPDSLKVSFETK